MLKKTIINRENNNPNFVIYGLRVINTTHIRYVGYTTECPKKRFKRHLSSKKSDYKTNWINSIGKENIEFFIIEDNIKTHKILCEREIFYISKYRNEGHKLTNLTNGGDGWYKMSLSENHKRNISLNHVDVSGIKNPMFGKTHTNETKELLRISNTNKIVSSITRKKQSNNNIGSNNNKSILSESDVILIREIYKLDKLTYLQLATIYGVKKSAIHKIITRKTWKHI